MQNYQSSNLTVDAEFDGRAVAIDVAHFETTSPLSHHLFSVL